MGSPQRISNDIPYFNIKNHKTQPPINQLIRKNMGGGKILVKKIAHVKKML